MYAPAGTLKTVDGHHPLLEPLSTLVAEHPRMRGRYSQDGIPLVKMLPERSRKVNSAAAAPDSHCHIRNRPYMTGEE